MGLYSIVGTWYIFFEIVFIFGNTRVPLPDLSSFPLFWRFFINSGNGRYNDLFRCGSTGSTMIGDDSLVFFDAIDSFEPVIDDVEKKGME